MTSVTPLNKIRLAIERLASSYPFHAALLVQWKIVEDPSVGTMGIGFRDEQFILIYSPIFVDKITLDQLEGVLHHEANHVTLDHLSHRPKPRENHKARIVAEEVTVNEFVPEPLPGEAILLSQYRYLPIHESTDVRYDRLKKRIKKEPVTVDNHATWDEARQAPEQAQIATQICIASAWQSLNAKEKAKVEKVFVSLIKTDTDGVTDISDEKLHDGNASVHWTTLLQRFIGHELSHRPMFGRLPRRFPHLIGVLPARGRSAGRPKIMAVIDTSGSLEVAMLSDINAELAKMARTYAVLVVECDDQIRNVYPYHPVAEVSGRNGTDFRPPFESAFLRKHKPDMIIYFTDGEGPAPVRQPLLPTVWCLTPRGRKPAKWGQSIRMLDQKMHVKNQESLTLYRNSASQTRFSMPKIGTKDPKLGPKAGQNGARP